MPDPEPVLVKRRYTVAGNRAVVLGRERHEPGGEPFEAELDPVQEQQLIASGNLALAGKEPSVAEVLAQVGDNRELAAQKLAEERKAGTNE